MNIYVSNLSFNVQDEDLRAFFSPYGEVASAKVIMDKFTGRSKGFGFVDMSDDTAAKKAITALDNGSMDGRTLKVVEARPKQNRPWATEVLIMIEASTKTDFSFSRSPGGDFIFLNYWK